MASDDRASADGGAKIALAPSERARTNLALLYGGTGRTFRPHAVIGLASKQGVELSELDRGFSGLAPGGPVVGTLD
jgi:hypothetical protein